jgi:hypothetical protein
MEVGIEDCLHIEFEFDKQKYHLQVCLLVFVICLASGCINYITCVGCDIGQDLLFIGEN